MKLSLEASTTLKRLLFSPLARASGVTPQPRDLKRNRNLVGGERTYQMGPGKDEQAVRSRAAGWAAEPSPAAAFTALHFPLQFGLLCLHIVSDAYVLPPPPFLMIQSQKVVSAASGEQQEAPATRCFPLYLIAQTDPWLCQLNLHTRASILCKSRRD